MKKIIIEYAGIVIAVVLLCSFFCAFVSAKQTTSEMMFGEKFEQISVFAQKPVMVMKGEKLYTSNEEQEKILTRCIGAVRIILPAPVNNLVFVVQTGVDAVEQTLAELE